MFDNVDLNAMQFIAPLIILAITMTIIGFLYSILLKWLPKSLYNLFLGPVVLLVGGYIWIYPMNMGFYDFFK